VNNSKIFYYRDHNNGGLFDGNTAVDTQRAFGLYSADLGVRVRFRANELESGSGTIWGVGREAENDKFQLKVVKCSEEYYLRVNYLDKSYNFYEYKINCETIYEVKVKISGNGSGNGEIRLEIFDRYHTALYSENKTNNSDKDNYSITENNVYIGATNDSGNPTEGFCGFIFDWDTVYADTSDFSHFIFYKNFNGVEDNEVAESSGSYTGEIIPSVPDNFWPEKTEITTYLKEKSRLNINWKTDRYKAPVRYEMKLNIKSESLDIKENDTITIQIGEDVTNNEISAIFNIKELKYGDYYEITIICEDILQSTEKILAKHIAYYYKTYWTYEDPKWWSLYYPTSGISGDYYYDASNESNRWFNIEYVLKTILYMLQYDNLISFDTATLKASSSDLYEEYGGSSTYITYRYLIFHQGMFKYLGINDSSKNSLQDMNEILLTMFRTLRITYYFYNGKITFRKIGYSHVTHPVNYGRKHWKERNYKFTQIDTSIIENGVTGRPDLTAYYSSFVSDDFNDQTGSVVNSNYKLPEKKLLNNLNLPINFWIFWRESSSNMLHTFGSAGTRWLEQAAKSIDTGIRGLKKIEEIEVMLTKDNSRHYISKTDNLIENRSIITQEFE
jgi:hypothetical protein